VTQQLFWQYAAGAAGVLLMFGIVAAAAFEQGRASFKQELAEQWRKAACRECGRMPEARIIHASGCESGWPDPAKLFETLTRTDP
jgi:hypothetical protein